MSQKKFTSKLLSEFHPNQFPPVTTLIDASLKLTVDMGAPLTNPFTYRYLVSKLNFHQHA